MNTRYPWHKLVKPGDSFVWRFRKDERSIRTQAHKRGLKKGVVYTVHKGLVGGITVTLVELAPPESVGFQPTASDTPPRHLRPRLSDPVGFGG